MASVPRLFVVADLCRDGIVALSQEQGHYLVRVMRLAEGANLRVFNGRDGEWLASIDGVVGKSVLLKVGDQLCEQASGMPLTLAFAPLKKTRTDFVVEKATELGAAVIQPVLTERTQAERVRTDRLSALAMEAAEQTERLDLPRVCEPLKLHDFLDGWDKTARLYFADETGADAGQAWGGRTGKAAPLGDALRGSQPGAPAGMLIGPEGGFAPGERERLRALAFVVPVSLGPRILRAETAALASLTLYQACLGDWLAAT